MAQLYLFALEFSLYISRSSQRSGRLNYLGYFITISIYYLPSLILDYIILLLLALSRRYDAIYITALSLRNAAPTPP